MNQSSANTQRTGKRGGKRSTSWQAGQSGNPRGRSSVGLSWKELIVKIGDEQVPNSVLSWKEAVVRAAFTHAIKGNAAILRELMQRSEPQADELNVHHDWRELARTHGLSEADVIAEAEQIINESSDDPSGP